MNPIDAFKQEVKDNIDKQGQDETFKKESIEWLIKSCNTNYCYNFTCLGRPIIQFPQDILAIQELIWEHKPDLVIETGIAHGGLLIQTAAILELLGQDGEVLGIDIDIRAHNKEAIESHPMAKRIHMIEGSSVDDKVIEEVKGYAKNKKNIMVILDSLHTHDHVYQELMLYSPFVALNNYLIVLDTIIEFMPEEQFPNRPWGVGNNPYTASEQFLKENSDFVNNVDIENQLLVTVGMNGYLKRIKK